MEGKNENGLRELKTELYSLAEEMRDKWRTVKEDAGKWKIPPTEQQQRRWNAKIKQIRKVCEAKYSELSKRNKGAAEIIKEDEMDMKYLNMKLTALDFDLHMQDQQLESERETFRKIKSEESELQNQSTMLGYLDSLKTQFNLLLDNIQHTNPENTGSVDSILLEVEQCHLKVGSGLKDWMESVPENFMWDRPFVSFVQIPSQDPTATKSDRESKSDLEAVATSDYDDNGDNLSENDDNLSEQTHSSMGDEDSNFETTNESMETKEMEDNLKTNKEDRDETDTESEDEEKRNGESKEDEPELDADGFLIDRGENDDESDDDDDDDDDYSEDGDEVDETKDDKDYKRFVSLTAEEEQEIEIRKSLKLPTTLGKSKRSSTAPPNPLQAATKQKNLSTDNPDEQSSTSAEKQTQSTKSAEKQSQSTKSTEQQQPIKSAEKQSQSTRSIEQQSQSSKSAEKEPQSSKSAEKKSQSTKPNEQQQPTKSAEKQSHSTKSIEEQSQSSTSAEKISQSTKSAEKQSQSTKSAEKQSQSTKSAEKKIQSTKSAEKKSQSTKNTGKKSQPTKSSEEKSPTQHVSPKSEILKTETEMNAKKSKKSKVEATDYNHQVQLVGSYARLEWPGYTIPLIYVDGILPQDPPILALKLRGEVETIRMYLLSSGRIRWPDIPSDEQTPLEVKLRKKGEGSWVEDTSAYSGQPTMLSPKSNLGSNAFFFPNPTSPSTSCLPTHPQEQAPPESSSSFISSPSVTSSKRKMNDSPPLDDDRVPPKFDERIYQEQIGLDDVEDLETIAKTSSQSQTDRNVSTEPSGSDKVSQSTITPDIVAASQNFSKDKEDFPRKDSAAAATPKMENEHLTRESSAKDQLNFTSVSSEPHSILNDSGKNMGGTGSTANDENKTHSEGKQQDLVIESGQSAMKLSKECKDLPRPCDNSKSIEFQRDTEGKKKIKKKPHELGGSTSSSQILKELETDAQVSAESGKNKNSTMETDTSHGPFPLTATTSTSIPKRKMGFVRLKEIGNSLLQRYGSALRERKSLRSRSLETLQRVTKGNANQKMVILEYCLYEVANLADLKDDGSVNTYKELLRAVSAQIDGGQKIRIRNEYIFKSLAEVPESKNDLEKFFRLKTWKRRLPAPTKSGSSESNEQVKRLKK